MKDEHLSNVTERALLVRADNPSVMTLDGTNTWLLREPGSSSVVVLDPGPLDEDHLARLIEVAGRDGGHIDLVLYSHWHPDHTDSIDRFFELTGAPARALDSTWCRNAEPLTAGEVLSVGGLEIEVMATPGHTMDSICLVLTAEQSLLSADTILGTGTTVVAHPDGALGPYLDSLAAIRQRIVAGDVRHILPGHGPSISDPLTVVDGYLAHRASRLEQVRAALEAGDTTAMQVVERVYAEVDRSVWFAAEMSVRAQMDYLAGRSDAASMEV
ncbi:MBL fold metallo-hydrolase [Leucobacter sp. UT-8R-CII-1-4]|uniref:MBL fold metallo-hydrolase n=1 Tax=Leucobacter sp. UT-8R-CII-1-4 TaxID=3040075 RepID=UPI0024A7EA52|nr:MBL fold metallo-hydrolase [Leucobacter sp. UT-8R-CII-1-4]MDI6024197.1 MBL fold metallo-hydrolase [Leucobacter sp. UT-8R-CII-1-4]